MKPYNVRFQICKRPLKALQCVWNHHLSLCENLILKQAAEHVNQAGRPVLEPPRTCFLMSYSSIPEAIIVSTFFFCSLASALYASYSLFSLQRGKMRQVW